MDASHDVMWSVDEPVPDALVSPTGFLLRGWVMDGARELAVVMARHAGEEIGATAVPILRDDVERGKYCGYRIFIEPESDEPPGDFDIELFARFRDDENREVAAGVVTCRLSTFDERTQDYGGLCESYNAVVMHRADIYSVGPPSRTFDPELLGLLQSYVATEASVLDVGCGAGPYAGILNESDRRWAGCDVRADLIAELRARGLPATLVESARLPFEDHSFDFTMCIEVLEHIDDFESFVADISRVARYGACFSVPNARAIPRLAPLGVVPWHLLESSHVNFFTAVSLRELLGRHFAYVDAFEYGALPISAIDGTPVFNHIFAVAMHAH